MKTTKEIIKELKSFSEPEYLVMGEKFACPVENSWGVPIPYIRKLAREIGKDHELALELWKHRIREVKQLATLIDKPEKVTEKQMEFWVKAFDCWVLCDHVCMNLFDKTKFADFEKFFPLIKSAATDERNFVKKAVNWALRQIGKRNEDLRKSALKTAKEILKFDSKSARWIASDAIIELKKK